MNTQELTLAGIAIAPLIVGIVELSKVYIPTKYAPLVALVLGVLAGVGAQATLPHPVWVNGLVLGVAVGLSSSGLYSGIAKLTADANPTPAPAACGTFPLSSPVPAPVAAPVADPVPEPAPPAS